MSKQDILIEQPAGLGDIIFCQKIAHRLEQEKKYNDIYWPVSDVFEEDVKRINTPAKFINIEDELYQKRLLDEHMFGVDEYLRIPLHRADQLISNVTSLLTCKYELVGLNWDDWVDYFSFKRDYEKENDLFSYLNLDPDSNYTVVSDTCGSPPNQKKYIIDFKSEFDRVININIIDGFSVFDWCGILENASSIHMIDTCFVYIIEKLRLKTNYLHLYSRYKPADFSHIQQLLRVKWKYEEW